jgi:phenylpyruvate tautomerase PptA (4-oxalocrotonate tautomerase family)
MPFLTINSTKEITPEAKEAFFDEVASLYADVMDSETTYLSMRFCSVSRENLWLGRATGSNPDVVVLEADVRAGRAVDQRRAFAVSFMEEVHEQWGVPHSNMKVVFTEHDGSHMMGYDRIGSDWGTSNPE